MVTEIGLFRQPRQSFTKPDSPDNQMRLTKYLITIETEPKTPTGSRYL